MNRSFSNDSTVRESPEGTDNIHSNLANNTRPTMRTTEEKLLYAIRIQDAESTRNLLAKLNPAAIQAIKAPNDGNLLHHALECALENGENEIILDVLLENPSVCALIVEKSGKRLAPIQTLFHRLPILKSPGLIFQLLRHTPRDLPWINESIPMINAIKLDFPAFSARFVLGELTPLMAILATTHNLELLQALLEKRPDFASSSPSVLALCIYKEWTEAIAVLLDKGANIDPETMVVLTTAVAKQINTHLIQGLLSKILEKIPPTFASDGFSYSPLMLTCLLQEEARISDFLATGATVNANKEGASPLFFACECPDPVKRMAMVRLLLANGAQNTINYVYQGFSPLGIAAFYGDEELVTLLLSFGADPTLGNSEQLPLCLSVNQDYPNPAIVDTLLKHGAKHNLAAYLTQEDGQVLSLLQTIALKSSPMLLKIVCDHIGTGALADWYYQQNGALDLRALAGKNNQMRSLEPHFKNEFEFILLSALCFHDIHHYLVDKSKEDCALRYEERLENFAKLLMELKKRGETPAEFSVHAHALIADVPSVATLGWSVLGVSGESKERYKKLLARLGFVPPSVLLMRLNEYLAYLHSEHFNARISQEPDPELIMVQQLKEKMKKYEATPVGRRPYATLNDPMLWIGYAIKTSDTDYLTYLLDNLGANDELWTYDFYAENRGTYERLVNFVLDCNSKHPNMEFIRTVFDLLHDKNETGFLKGLNFVRHVQSLPTSLLIVKNMQNPARNLMLKMLIDYGAKATLPFKTVEEAKIYKSYIVTAAEIGYCGIIAQSRDPDALDAKGWKDVFLAALKFRQLDVINLLLDKPVTIPDDAFDLLNYRSNTLTPIEREIIKTLLLKMSTAAANKKYGKAQDTPLIITCYINEPAVINDLITVKKVTTRDSNPDRLTPLHIAVQYCSYDVCQMLAARFDARDANVKSVSDEQTLLHLACSRQEQVPGERVAIVKLLHRFNFSESITIENRHGEFPLMVACLSNDIGLVEYLRETYQASVNQINKAGKNVIDITYTKAQGNRLYYPLINHLLANGALLIDTVRPNYTNSLWMAANNSDRDYIIEVVRTDGCRQLLSHFGEKFLSSLLAVNQELSELQVLLESGCVITPQHLQSASLASLKIFIRYIGSSRPELKSLKAEIAEFLARSPEGHQLSDRLMKEIGDSGDLVLLNAWISIFDEVSDDLFPMIKDDSTGHGMLMHPLLYIIFHGTLAQVHAMCCAVSYPRFTLLHAKPDSGRHDLFYLGKQNPLLQEGELAFEFNSVFCLQATYQYLIDKSTASGSNQSRYIQRLQDFSALFIQLESLLPRGFNAFQEHVDTIIATIPELEVRTLSILGKSFSTSRERYLALRRLIADTLAPTLWGQVALVSARIRQEDKSGYSRDERVMLVQLETNFAANQAVEAAPGEGRSLVESITSQSYQSS